MRGIMVLQERLLEVFVGLYKEEDWIWVIRTGFLDKIRYT